MNDKELSPSELASAILGGIIGFLICLAVLMVGFFDSFLRWLLL